MSQLVQQQTQHLLLQPNVLNVVKQELFNVVNTAIAKCYADLNFKVPDDPSYLVNEVTDSIQERFPSLRLAEIPIAFANGIRGKYGEYFGLCVVSFELFVQGYLASSDRVKLVEEKNRLMIGEKTEPTADDKFSTAKKLALELYEKVKANRPAGLTATAVYTFLNSIGLIAPDYKKGMMKEALSLLVQEKEKELAFCTELMKRRQLNTDLELLKQNIASDILTPAQHEECKRLAKRLAITNLLRDLLMDDTDLNNLIEEKRNFYKQTINK